MTFDIHPLVHLAMRSWLKANDQWEPWVEKALSRLVKIDLFDHHYETRETWIAYVTHATHLGSFIRPFDLKASISLLTQLTGSLLQEASRDIPVKTFAYIKFSKRYIETRERGYPSDLLIVKEWEEWFKKIKRYGNFFEILMELDFPLVT